MTQQQSDERLFLRTLSLLRYDCQNVLQRFKAGIITRDESAHQLLSMEKVAYKANPKAEPDGEITYTVASVLEQIDSAMTTTSPVEGEGGKV